MKILVSVKTSAYPEDPGGKYLEDFLARKMMEGVPAYLALGNYEIELITESIQVARNI